MSINSPTSPQTTSGSSSWTEPPWTGWIDTTGDALLILEAARRGLIPRVTRRLVDSERKMITSGSVFVFDEDESGIKRWTDGFFWSPSRILGNFLLYRETEKRGTGHKGKGDGSISEHSNALLVNEQQYIHDTKPEGHALSRPKSDVPGMGLDRQRERNLVGSLTNSYKFKPDGMMKKTFSLTISGVSQHLISYYKIEDVEQGRLRTPSSLPELMALDISPEYLDKTHFRNPPKVEVGYDGVTRYRGEADDAAPSPQMATTPLSTNLPLLSTSRHGGIDNDEIPPTPTVGKRAKRIDPYGTSSGSKRSKKVKSPQHSRDSDAQSSTSQPSPIISSPQQGPYGVSEQSPTVPHAYPYSPYSVPPPAYFPHGYAMHAAPHAYPSPPATSGTPASGSVATGSSAPGAPSASSPTAAPGQPMGYPGYQPPMGTDPSQAQAQPYSYYPAHPAHYQYGAGPWNYHQYPAMQGMHPPPQSAPNTDSKGSDAHSNTAAGEASDEV